MQTSTGIFRLGFFPLHRVEQLIDENAQPAITQAHAACRQAQIDGDALRVALEVGEIEVVSGQHVFHRRVVEQLGMPAHGREHRAALAVRFLVEIQRRAFDRRADMGGRRIL